MKEESVLTIQFWRKPLALGLSLSLLFAMSGCGKDGGNGAAGPTPTAAVETREPEEEPIDYSKYNAYVTVYDTVYSLSQVLDAYFAAVADTPEFALLEGGDYGAVRDVYTTDLAISYALEEALDWTTKEPGYPNVDSVAKRLVPDMITLQKQFSSLELYMVFSEFEEDNYEKAAACHAEIYPAAEGFYQWASRFLSEMDVLTDEISAVEMEKLLKNEELIAYYSNLTMDGAQDVLAAIRAQLAGLEEGGALSTGEIAAAYEQFKEDSATLLNYMGDEEQIAKIKYFVDGSKNGEDGPTYARYYTTSVENLRYYMETLMERIGAQEDVGASMADVSDGLSNLIDRYNRYIAN